MVTFITSLILSAVVALPSLPGELVDDTKKHLNQYSEFMQTHHDNIDDSESHTHTHKHSEDGEEHEHHHDHSNISDAPTNNLFSPKESQLNLCDACNSLSITASNLISDPHLRGIFKPPRV